MKIAQSIVAGFAVAFALTSTPVIAAETDYHGPDDKLFRGIVNVFTGWVEIPMRVLETKAQADALTGFTWGLARGLGYTYIRTLSGVYELFTFPFPSPPGFEPVLMPEFVFSGNSDTDPEEHYAY